jgi:hypothetical protein
VKQAARQQLLLGSGSVNTQQYWGRARQHMHVTVEELLEVMFYLMSIQRLYNE